MTDFQSPGTKSQLVRKGAIVRTGISTTIGGYQGICEKGPANAPTQVTSTDDFKEIFGNKLTQFPQIMDALVGFFGNGGQTCYVNRTVDPAAVAASRVHNTLGPASYAQVSSSAGTFVLNSADTIVGKIDGAPGVTVTFNAGTGSYLCTGGTYAAGAGGDSLSLTVNGVPGTQTIDFSTTGGTKQDYIDTLNAGLVGAKAVADGGADIRIVTDRKGSQAGGAITGLGGAIGAKLGVLAGAFTAGTGNVGDIRAVTAAEVKTLFDAAFASTVTNVNLDGSVTWQHSIAGASHSVQVDATSTADAKMGFDNLVHSGGATTSVATMTVTASSVGFWGSNIKSKAVRVDTTITKSATLAAGTYTTIPITQGSKVVAGDQISITNVGGTTRGVVASVDGNSVTFAASVVVAAPGFDGSQNVIRETFNLEVYNNSGKLISPSPFKDLRMSPLAVSSYFVTIVNSTPRTPVVVTDAAPSASDPRPQNDSAPVFLTGGSDGGAVGAADYIGDQGARTGVWAWNKARDVNLISIPGVADPTTEGGLGSVDGALVLKAGLETYLESRLDVQAVASGPKGMDYLAIKDWVTLTANFASIYWGFHWTHYWAVDAESGVKQLKSPEGYVQGIIARTRATRNFAKAPAGIVDGQVRGIVGLEYDIEENSPEYNAIYPFGINATLNFPGEGYAVWGDVTLDSTGEFDTFGMVGGFCIAQRESKRRTRFVNFENNNPTTRAQVVKVMTALLGPWREKQILQGESNDEAFFIICDDTNNTPLVVRSKKMVIRVGLAFQIPGEFVEFTFEQDTRAIDAALASQTS